MVKSDTANSGTGPARRLVARAGVDRLIFLTDAVRAPDPASVMRRLPVGSIVIMRDYDQPDRVALAARLRPLARTLGHWFLVAGDAALARAVRADGVHLPEHQLKARPLNRFGFSLITAACHSRAALKRAADRGVDLALVSPVFPTGSHPRAPALGPHRFARLIEGADVPVAALGGVATQTAGAFRGLRVAAIAGISGLVD